MPKKTPVTPASQPARASAPAVRRKKVAAPPPVRVPSASTVRRRLRLIENKRSAILEAALEFFSRYGLHGTSVDEIAARADVSKSNLLYYFRSKEELYVALLHELLVLWLEPLRAFSADQDPVEAIKHYIRLKMVNSRDHPEASRLFCLEMVQGAPLLRVELDRLVSDVVHEKSEVIRAWVASGRLAPIDPWHLIFALWSMTQHYADFAVQVESITGKTLEDEAFFEQAIENVQALILRGIVAR
jgi:TetR/AcrR family transcriptional regulator